jgi:hypothetical protein
LFPYLSDDLKMAILSFVATAPLENPLAQNYYPDEDSDATILGTGKGPTLTCALPLVSHKFRTFSQHALMRQVQQEPLLWKTALSHIISSGSISSLETANATECVVEQAFAVQRQAYQAQSVGAYGYKQFYQHVVSQYIRIASIPVYHHPGPLQLGEPYQIALSSPTYLYMIHQLLLKGESHEARHGAPISRSIYFVHANRDLAPTSPATIVRIQSCQYHYGDEEEDEDHHPEDMQRNPTKIELTVVPVEHVWLERLWIHSECGRLFMATCLRMGMRHVNEMNFLIRQEVLEHMMDRLLQQLEQASSDDGANVTEFDLQQQRLQADDQIREQRDIALTPGPLRVDAATTLIEDETDEEDHASDAGSDVDFDSDGDEDTSSDGFSDVEIESASVDSDSGDYLESDDSTTDNSGSDGDEDFFSEDDDVSCSSSDGTSLPDEPQAIDQTIEYDSDEDFGCNTSMCGHQIPVGAFTDTGTPSRIFTPGIGLEHQRQVQTGHGDPRGLFFHLQQQPDRVRGGSDETVCSVVSNETHVTTEQQRF